MTGSEGIRRPAAAALRRAMALGGCVLWLAIAPTRAHATWYSRTEAIMDTRIYVELWDTHPKHANAAIDAVMAEMHHVDDVMSDFKPESQLSRINEHAAQHPVAVSPELYHLIKLSTHYSQITDGAFDITVESVWKLYHFRQHSIRLYTICTWGAGRLESESPCFGDGIAARAAKTSSSK